MLPGLFRILNRTVRAPADIARTMILINHSCSGVTGGHSSSIPDAGYLPPNNSITSQRAAISRWQKDLSIPLNGKRQNKGKIPYNGMTINNQNMAKSFKKNLFTKLPQFRAASCLSIDICVRHRE
jgi:hypothetical protein